MDTLTFQIPSPRWLLVPYIANILILAPVCYSLFIDGTTGTIFEGRVEDSEGLRLLVASLYLAILTASGIGLFLPAYFSSIILIQIFYKSTWLLLFVLPLIMRGEPVPIGISVTFLCIVITYPVFFWLATR